MPDIFTADKNVGKEIEKPVSDKPENNQEIDPKKLVLPSEHPHGHNFMGHSHSPLQAFMYYPDQASFKDLDPEEKIVLILRKHPITNLGWLFISVILILTPLFLFVIPLLDFLPQRFQIVVVLMWYLATFTFILEKFLIWFFNVNIITDERIFDVDFANFVYREITDANIDQIQDVTVEMSGAIRTLFNYGDLIVQTAAEVPRVEFEALPKPDQVAKVLRDLRLEEEKEKLEERIR